ncbi:MAG: hypothetical protein OEM38_06650 [Gammaproteobacteria bacterium]|nr:hypothetical protein [Gammaproteobacteria bacterium]
MCRLCWVIVVVLSLATSGLLYKFVFSGSVVAGDDGRQAIQLSAGERDIVFLEMRTFLDSVQKITKGIVDKDMKLIADAANKVGSAAQQQMPGTLVGKLPLEFKKLGFDTHSKFSQLAMDAESLGDEQHALKQVSDLMENCVACHETYKIEVSLK